jgi:hypothetical protein
LWCGFAHLKLSAAASANRQFKLNKRRQLFICKHNKMLSVGAMRVCNPERSLVGINR